MALVDKHEDGTHTGIDFETLANIQIGALDTGEGFEPGVIYRSESAGDSLLTPPFISFRAKGSSSRRILLREQIRRGAVRLLAEPEVQASLPTLEPNLLPVVSREQEPEDPIIGMRPGQGRLFDIDGDIIRPVYV